MKILYSLSIALFLSLSLFAQWTDNVNENVHVANANAADIQSIGVSGGKTWIAFYSQRGNNYDMRAQLLDSTGKKMLGDNGVLVSNKPSGSATFVFNVTINGQGDLLIGYQYLVNDTLKAVVSRIDQTGNLIWGNGVVVGPGLSPYPTVLTSGETVVAWQNSVSNTISLQRIDSAGGFRIDSVFNVQLGSSTTTHGQVIANNNGYFTLVFQKSGIGTNTTLYAQRFNRFFKAAWNAPVQLSNQATAAYRYYSVIKEQDTTYVGYYSSEGVRFNAFLQRINPDESNRLPYGINGAHFGTDTMAGDYYQQTISIALQDSAETVWAVCNYTDPGQTQYGVYAQRFQKSTGAVLFNVKGKKIYAVSDSLYQFVGDLQLTGDDRPGFLTNNIKNNLRATKLDIIGNPIEGADGVLLGGTANAKSRICFAANEVIAVAVWSENRGGGDLPYAQNITPDGVTGVFPVLFSSFRAVKNGTAADLSWTTATETNNKGFYVERSGDGRSFTQLGFVASKGNSSNGNSYLFSDKLPLSSNNYYRLQQVDINGHIYYSQTVLLSFTASGALVVSRIYPNPATNVVNLQLQSTTEGKLSLAITSSNGTILKRQNQRVAAGAQTIPVSIASLAKGTYYMKATLNGAMQVIKFTKL